MKERIKSLDAIRAIAILSVLLIHTTTRTLEAAKFEIASYPWTLFLNQFVRFAVPLFFIISGLVLELSFKENMSYFSFLKRRFSRIFIPYVLWSLFYYFFIYTQNHDNLLKVLTTGDASYQLYFIPTLCIFYLIFPLLHKAYKIISNWAVLLIIFTSEFYLLYKDYFVKDFNLSDPVHIAILAYFFFIVGIIAGHNFERLTSFVKKWISLIFPAALILSFYVFWEGRTRYIETGNFLSYYSQWRPSVMIYTLIIGLVLLYVFEVTRFKDSTISRFSKHSFLVFFIHVAILEGLWSLAGKNLFILIGVSSIGKAIFDPLFFVSVAFTSFLISYLLHKIPEIYKYIG